MYYMKMNIIEWLLFNKFDIILDKIDIRGVFCNAND